MPNAATPDQLFEHARQAYAALGVDVDQALRTLGQTPISLHCWQGDDVTGFENQTSASGGGIAVTGAYPGKATNPDELRADLEKALQHLPGKHKLNLHACYLENGGTAVDRDAIEPKHFARWIDWCKANQLGMDFNPTCFAHRLADDGFTLSHQDAAVRDFWIAHCQASRNIGAFAAEQLGETCVTNVWIPDGFKDMPADRMAPRQRLQTSLDTVFSEPLPSNHIDAVESKLFGIGSESFVVGSHEFYMGYATARQTALCLDMGHFHPTESVADKISSTLLYVPELLLHTSRGVRWDSDHVVTTNDDTKALMQAVVGCEVLDRVHIGLDFFDASINRIAAWVIGARATRKALLQALLTPWDQLKAAENAGDLTKRLALQEAGNTLPFAAVWQRFLEMENCQPDIAWLQDVRTHEQQVLNQR